MILTIQIQTIKYVCVIINNWISLAFNLPSVTLYELNISSIVNIGQSVTRHFPFVVHFQNQDSETRNVDQRKA